MTKASLPESVVGSSNAKRRVLSKITRIIKASKRVELVIILQNSLIALLITYNLTRIIETSIDFNPVLEYLSKFSYLVNSLNSNADLINSDSLSIIY